jgi:hypothetical protein
LDFIASCTQRRTSTASRLTSRGLDGVAGDARQRCSTHAFAADVADRQPPPPIAELEQVVEVAADLARRAGRPVARGDRARGSVGQVVGEQAALERLRDPTLLGVQPSVLVRQELERAGRGDRVVATTEEPLREPCEAEAERHADQSDDPRQSS